MSENKIKTKFKMNKKMFLIIGLIILVIAFIFFRIMTANNDSEKSNENNVLNVKVTEAKYIDIETSSLLTGRVKPIEEAAIVPKLAGEVTGVYVALGDYVSKGNTLFDMDKIQAQNSYNQAAEAYATAKLNYERMSSLYGEGAISAQQFEQAQSQLSIASSTKNMAADALNYCVITAPISGYVTSINITAGEIASQAMPAVTISNVSTLILEAGVSENIINKLKIGDKVEVSVESASATSFDGVITTISPVPPQGSLTYPIEISVENKDGLIKAGMFAEIKIIADKKQSVLAVPSDAIMIKSGITVVAVLGEKNTVKFTTVSIGTDTGEFVEILEGIKSGDQIITEGQNYLDEESIVKVIKD